MYLDPLSLKAPPSWARKVPAEATLGAPSGHPPRAWTEQEKLDVQAAMRRIEARERPLGEDWMRVGPNTDAAIWRPWGRETGEL